ncbi:asparagine synthase (glutamine-hydrolyzing) [Desulfosarcina alkanivorans]|uniref:asparagine synthase (glutamine-hydrolyzing) n=1 Tax=Desulfosarcina alkanivorans TaxID=571177 RepID=UPI0012D33263|nr:asparagine synthase (glutamine-hydrolyzing) [Desulfosarcina alkanivorans]
MCGIVGFFSQENFELLSNYLPAAVQSLSRRGPDDFGVAVSQSDGIGIGHRRLSIIDLSFAGHQPMESADHCFTIVFNGEIYNFKDLRKELQTLGFFFRSNSDTEVVLNSYRQWGPACLDRFIGMFAFAIWDKTSQKFFIARDRLGIKPLYYYFKEGTFIFGSELKSLMAFPVFQRQADPDAFHLYLHYQYVPAPKTIFENTFKLEPGHFLIFDGKALTKRQWWKIPGSESEVLTSNRMSENDAISRLDRLLTQAVSDRLISDVPLGALLSGGVDSSIVVALMQKVNRSPVKTFSIGFEEKGYNEAPWAREIANHLGTDHTELYASSQDALQVIPQLPEIYDEPFGDSSSIPTYLVSMLTRRQVTVALSGDGGDEQFAGYVRYWMTAAVARYINCLPRSIRKRIGNHIGKIPISKLHSFYKKVWNILPQRMRVENFSDKWQKLVNQLSHSELPDLYRATVSIWSKDDIFSLTGCCVPQGNYENIFSSYTQIDTIQRLMMVDQQTYLPDDMLTKVDRASMAASLEVRVPLLDHRVVEFTSQLPMSLKIRDGKGKYLLTELLCKYVPRQLVDRPKMGFGVPIAQWFRKELKELLNDYLSFDRLKVEGLLDCQLVQRFLSEHQLGLYNHQHRLWTLLMWEMWRERWLK